MNLPGIEILGLVPANATLVETLLGTVLWVFTWLLPWILGAVAAYALLSLPYRRAERARLFLDLLAIGLSRGRRPEEVIRELATTGERSLGVRFQLVAAHLENGHGLVAALERVPRFLPPGIRNTLRAGVEAGDLRTVLPACQTMLRDSPAKTRHLMNYLIVLFTAFAPSAIAVITMLNVFVLPKFRIIGFELSEGQMMPSELPLLALANLIVAAMGLVSLLIIVGLLVHIGGPRIREWLGMGFPPIGDWIAYGVPWTRKRMLRDFAGTLGVLLDAGIVEERALQLAGEVTANTVFVHRAERAISQLQHGTGLAEALGRLDGTGEFRWRVANAARGQGTFSQALAGWREALDARAFQQEQAAAHLVTTGLILMNGLMAGVVVVSIFHVLIEFVEASSLW